MRTGLAARTISALARGSTSTVNGPPAAAPGAGAPATAPSPRRWMIAAMSLATPFTIGMTSTSVAPGVSSAAMILPMRCRLSA